MLCCLWDDKKSPGVCIMGLQWQGSIDLYVSCFVPWINTFLYTGWTLRTKWMEFVEFLRRDSSSSKAVICSGSKDGSEMTGRALRLRAIKVMKLTKMYVEKSAPQFCALSLSASQGSTCFSQRSNLKVAQVFLTSRSLSKIFQLTVFTCVRLNLSVLSRVWVTKRWPTVRGRAEDCVKTWFPLQFTICISLY